MTHVPAAQRGEAAIDHCEPKQRAALHEDGELRPGRLGGAEPGGRPGDHLYCVLCAVVYSWVAHLAWPVRVVVISPAARHGQPALVLGTAVQAAPRRQLRQPRPRQAG